MRIGQVFRHKAHGNLKIGVKLHTGWDLKSSAALVEALPWSRSRKSALSGLMSPCINVAICLAFASARGRSECSLLPCLGGDPVGVLGEELSRAGEHCGLSGE
jgi:hypothetical protein